MPGDRDSTILLTQWEFCYIDLPRMTHARAGKQRPRGAGLTSR